MMDEIREMTARDWLAVAVGIPLMYALMFLAAL